ncbi:helix-turn-helix transcriptional regulator [Marinomonas posidonica]|uniref:Helix-turn-helix domain protein n=1 Tax=Marinomonas posidonica (strain CECT 7376 / NCIMB 14433 / IVIA-Po-181) TaxID=491952 RepID=F6CS37_MARPP|nr:helix-turn-helix transcriptional regulator [Marinomonas posidonica]AEF56144.1 helix-turn-helix domain protein [Marinomonas posidonica IVIA-Po-181]
MKMKDQLDSPQPMKKPKAKSKKAEVKKKKQAKLKAKKAEKDKKALKKVSPVASKKDKKSAKLEATDNKSKAISVKQPETEVTDTPAADSTLVEKTIKQVASQDSATSTTPAEPKPVQRATRRPRTTRRKPSVEDIQALAENANRQRASKNLATLTQDEQKIATQDVVKRLLVGDLSQGEALRELRVKVLGLRQEAYTELTGVSRKTLSEVENDKGNYTAEIINKMFRPFQLKVSLVPDSSEDLKAILNQR